MNSESGDHDIAQLLSRSGVRPEPSLDARQRVHDRLLGVWQQLPLQEEIDTHQLAEDSNTQTVGFHLRSVRFATAAAFGVAVIGAWLAFDLSQPAPMAIANIAYSTGGYAVTPPGDGSTKLLRGSTVQTSDHGRMLLVLDEHTTVRLDQGTRATLRSAEEIYLAEGRVYVDSHGGSNRIRVTTDRATVTKVGTQFEVGVSSDVVEIAVRQGQINVDVDDSQTRAQASNGLGEILRFDAKGQQTKTVVATTDSTRWQWTQLSRPDFDFSSSTYYGYLSWAARERGLTLRFGDQMLEQAAKNQTGGGRFDASDEDIDNALGVDGFFTRARGEPHELLVVRP